MYAKFGENLKKGRPKMGAPLFEGEEPLREIKKSHLSE